MEKSNTIILILSIIQIISSFFYKSSPVALGILLICAISIFIYTPIVAKRYNQSMPLWGFLTFFFGAIAGLIFAFAIKPKTVSQPTVNQQ